MNRPTKKALKQYLLRATAELNRGEKVKVDLTGQLHSRYVDYKLEGMFSDLMCVKENNEYYLARIH